MKTQFDLLEGFDWEAVNKISRTLQKAGKHELIHTLDKMGQILVRQEEQLLIFWKFMDSVQESGKESFEELKTKFEEI